MEEDTAAAGAAVQDDAAADTNVAAFAMSSVRGEAPHSPSNHGGMFR